MHTFLTVVATLGIVAVGGAGAYRLGQATTVEHHGRHRLADRRTQIAEAA